MGPVSNCASLGLWGRNQENACPLRTLDYIFSVPNQRAKNKAFLGGYIEVKLYRRLLRSARHEGMEHNVFGFVQTLIKEGLGRRQRAEERRRATKAKRA